MTTATPTEAVKEAERLLERVVLAALAEGAHANPMGSRSYHEATVAAQTAMLAFIRKLVEAQPAAVAGEAMPDQMARDVLTALECGCLWTADTEAEGRMRRVCDEFRRWAILRSSAAPAAPSVGEPQWLSSTRDVSDAEAAQSVLKGRSLATIRGEAEALNAAIRAGDGDAIERMSAAPAAPSVGEPPGMVTLKERIDELIAKHGTLRASARALEVDAGYLSRLRYGEKDTPGETLLTRMGLRRTELYERLAASPAVPAGVPTDELLDALLSLYHSLPDVLPEAAHLRFAANGKWEGNSHYALRGHTVLLKYRADDMALVYAAMDRARALLAGGEQKAGSVHPSAAVTDAMVEAAMLAFTRDGYACNRDGVSYALELALAAGAGNAGVRNAE